MLGENKLFSRDKEEYFDISNWKTNVINNLY